MNQRSIIIDPDDVVGTVYVDEPETHPFPAGVLPPEHPIWDKIEAWHRKNGYTNTAASPFAQAQTADQLESLVKQNWSKMTESLAVGLGTAKTDVEKIRDQVEQMRLGYDPDTLTPGQLRTISRMAEHVVVPQEDYSLVMALHYVISRSIINLKKSPPADMMPVLVQYYAAYKETFGETLGEPISPEVVAKLTGKST